MKQITATGQTVEEAVQSALKQLGITEDQAKINIVDEGKKGILGLFGSKPAIVKVTKKEDPIEKLENYVKKIVSAFHVPIELDTKVEQNTVTMNLSGEDIALLIGKRGQTLNAVQSLAQLAMNRYSEVFYTVVIDAEGYRERRRETLISLAERQADRAVKTKKEVTLDPMPSYERKIIHTTLQKNQEVETDSQGREPKRYVVIRPK